MRKVTTIIASILLVVTAAGVSADEISSKNKQGKKTVSLAEIDKKAPGFTLADPYGNEHSLSDFEGKWVVLEWTNLDCPFVRKHYDSGNMQSLQREFVKKGVVWLRICSSTEGAQGFYKTSVIADRLKQDKALQTAYLIDASGEIGRAYAAKTTPHMFVIDPKGLLRYAGGIDDKPTPRQADIDGAHNYVAASLNAGLEGQPIETKTSRPYGCGIKYAKK